ncbi:uncharacterized protein CLUP02_17640, partial [Colletotrichum lupini]
LAEIPGFHHLKSRLLSFPLQGSSRFYRVYGQLLRAVPHQTPSNWPSDGQLLNIKTSILSSFTASSPTTANSSTKVLGPFQRLKLFFFLPGDTASGTSNGSHPAPNLPSDINVLGLASSAE